MSLTVSFKKNSLVIIGLFLGSNAFCAPEADKDAGKFKAIMEARKKATQDQHEKILAILSGLADGSVTVPQAASRMQANLLEQWNAEEKMETEMKSRQQGGRSIAGSDRKGNKAKRSESFSEEKE